MGCGPQVGPFPSRPIMGPIRGGRDPPTNPSRHLKKERVILHLKWLLKEGQGGEPTAATAAATAAAPPRAAAVPAAFPCLAHWLPSCSFPVAAVAAAASGRRRRRRRRIAAPPPSPPPSPSQAIPRFTSSEIFPSPANTPHSPRFLCPEPSPPTSSFSPPVANPSLHFLPSRRASSHLQFCIADYPPNPCLQFPLNRIPLPGNFPLQKFSLFHSAAPHTRCHSPSQSWIFI